MTCKRYACALFFCSLLLAATGCERAASTPQQMANGTPVAAAKVLGTFQGIAGTHYQMAAISNPGDEGGRFDVREAFSLGGVTYSGVYNYVFLDADTETTHALLATNDEKIVSIEGLPNSNSGPGPAEQTATNLPVSWWLYSIVKKDSNQDGQLTYQDKQILAISDAGGSGYAELIAGVDQLLGTVLKNETTLLIVYASNGKNFLAHIDLAGRVVAKTTELPSFGENSK